MECLFIESAYLGGGAGGERLALRVAVISLDERFDVVADQSSRMQERDCCVLLELGNDRVHDVLGIFDERDGVESASATPKE